MQGLADGYFILPYTIGDYFANSGGKKVSTDHPEFKKALEDAETRTKKFLSINGKRTVDSFHKELGKIMWDYCGMARNKAGLQIALKRIPEIRAEFWENVKVLGSNEEVNVSLEKAGRVADFLEFAELMCIDALNREESCGGHFRTEYQTEDGEAKRNDEKFCYVSAWQYNGEGKKPTEIKEELVFENVKLTQRSYK
jgi:succinate dehydrogenase / fumarate reductase flavoprotein subunit